MKLLTSQNVIELITTEPGLRTVQLADKFDCEIDAIETILVEVIENGKVIAYKVESPNGREAMAYRLSGTEIQSEPMPNEGKQSPKTKIDQAIEFIKKMGGSATSSQLQTVLGLKAYEHASSYLAGAIKDKRLVKDGRDWMVGPGLIGPGVDIDAAHQKCREISVQPTFVRSEPEIALPTPHAAPPKLPIVAPPELRGQIASLQETLSAYIEQLETELHNVRRLKCAIEIAA